MRQQISIVPTYSQDGSVVTLVVEKLDSTFMNADELADVLETYIELLREPASDEGALAN